MFVEMLLNIPKMKKQTTIGNYQASLEKYRNKVRGAFRLREFAEQTGLRQVHASRQIKIYLDRGDLVVIGAANEQGRLYEWAGNGSFLLGE